MTPTELQQARRRANLTQAELAPLLGMRQSNLARLESGARQPTHIHAAAMAALLFIHAQHLLPQYIRQHQPPKPVKPL